MDAKEILEGNKLIAVFMGYIFIEENVLYDVCDDSFYKNYQPVTLYSKTPITLDEDRALQMVDNPDFGNEINPKWNNTYKKLYWESLNREHFIEPQYNSSWDWLMPVIEKIESLWFWVRVNQKWCTIEEWSQRKTIFHCGSDKHTKIEATWEAIVQFITWANKQN